MVVGMAYLDMQLPGNGSLKGKRRILNKLFERVKSNYNVSIAEVGDNDIWQRSQIGVTVVGNDSRYVNSVLDKLVNFIHNLNLSDIIDYQIEIIGFNRER